MTDQAIVTRPDGFIEDDLPCATCGYNLRTLPRKGRCPECGQDVRDSVLPTSPRFGSWREMRRVRVGIGLLVLSFLLPLLIYIVFWLTLRSGELRMQIMEDPTGIGAHLFEISAKAYSYYTFVVGPLQAAAVALMLAPLGRGLSEGRYWWRWGIVLVVATGVVGGLYTTVSFYAQLPTSAGIVLNPYITIGSSVMCQGGFLLAWSYLASRLCREHWLPAVLMWSVAVALTVSTCLGTVWSVVSYLDTKLATSGGPVVVITDAPAGHLTIQRCFSFWQDHVDPLVTLLSLIALWAYVRTLNAALQRPAPQGPLMADG